MGNFIQAQNGFFAHHFLHIFLNFCSGSQCGRGQFQHAPTKMQLKLCRQFSPVLHRQVHSQLWAIWGEHSNSTQGRPGLTVQTAKPACHLRSNIATTLYFKEAYCFKPFVFCSCWRVKNLYPRSVISIWLYSMLSFKG